MASEVLPVKKNGRIENNKLLLEVGEVGKDQKFGKKTCDGISKHRLPTAESFACEEQFMYGFLQFRTILLLKIQ